MTWAGSWKESFPIRSVLGHIHLESFLQDFYVIFDDYTSIANIQKRCGIHWAFRRFPLSNISYGVHHKTFHIFILPWLFLIHAELGRWLNKPCDHSPPVVGTSTWPNDQSVRLGPNSGVSAMAKTWTIKWHLVAEGAGLFSYSVGIAPAYFKFHLNHPPIK